MKSIIILLLVLSVIIVINGITSDVCLGDESHHYRFAKNIFNSGKRVSYDPAYESGNPPGFYYNTPPLWHFLLAILWKINGGVSQGIGQIYHTLFFFFIILITAMIAQDNTGDEYTAFIVAIIIATMPMIVSFSTLFYMDVPLTLFTTLSFYLILKNHHLVAGISFGLAYLVKLNAFFFLPGFLFIIIWRERKNIIKLFKILFYFVTPIITVYCYDTWWRKTHIVSKMDTMNLDYIVNRINVILTKSTYQEYLNASLLNPLDIVKYFGIPFLILLGFFLIHIKKWDKKYNIILVPVVSYFLFFYIIFGINSDIRYLIPIVPFLVLMVVPSMLPFKKPFMVCIISACILQFIATTWYVHTKRQIPFEINEVFNYIRENVSLDSVILYPEENLLLYTERRVVWSSAQTYMSDKRYTLNNLFWESDNTMINNFNINYILIKKSRIYDDKNIRHLGGYPESFVKRLPRLDGWVRVFENSEVSLWKKVL